MTIERNKIRWNGWGWAAHKDELAGREEVWTWLALELGMPSLLATPARPLEELRFPASRLGSDERARLVAILAPIRPRRQSRTGIPCLRPLLLRSAAPARRRSLRCAGRGALSARRRGDVGRAVARRGRRNRRRALWRRHERRGRRQRRDRPVQGGVHARPHRHGPHRRHRHGRREPRPPKPASMGPRSKRRCRPRA